MEKCSECDKPIYLRGWCRPHYRRWKKYGDPLGHSVKIVKECIAEDGCKSPAHCRGFCKKHYSRWRHHGDPLGGYDTPGIKLPWLLEHHLDEECAIWPFKLDKDGYGQQMRIGNRRVYPHQYAAELKYGPCPDDMESIHGPCHNPACISHTKWGTRKENSADRLRDGTSNRGQRNANVKLAECNVNDIRNLFKDGLTKASLAHKFNISHSTVCDIIKNRTWKYLNNQQIEGE